MQLGIDINIVLSTNSIFSICFIGNNSNIRYNVWTWVFGTANPTKNPTWSAIYTDNLKSYKSYSKSFSYNQTINLNEMIHCFTDETDTSYTLEIYNTNYDNNNNKYNMYLNTLIFEY